jgi:steroid Delta-isomerase
MMSMLFSRPDIYSVVVEVTGQQLSMVIDLPALFLRITNCCYSITLRERGYMTITTIPSVVNDYAAAINSLDSDSYANTFAPNATAYEPVGSPAYEGHAGVHAFFEATAKLFASINFRWTFVNVVGNEVAVKWQADGLGKNGQSVAFEGIDLMTLNGAGKIKSLRAFWDSQALVAQLTQ